MLHSSSLALTKRRSSALDCKHRCASLKDTVHAGLPDYFYFRALRVAAIAVRELDATAHLTRATGAIRSTKA
jgi:hypothetical protein